MWGLFGQGKVGFAVSAVNVAVVMVVVVDLCF